MSSIALLFIAIILRLVCETSFWVAAVTVEALSIIPIIFTAISGITALMTVILVLLTDWSRSKLPELRILWGLQGLFLLGPIVTFIFAIQAKNSS